MAGRSNMYRTLAFLRHTCPHGTSRQHTHGINRGTSQAAAAGLPTAASLAHTHGTSSLTARRGPSLPSMNTDVRCCGLVTQLCTSGRLPAHHNSPASFPPIQLLLLLLLLAPADGAMDAFAPQATLHRTTHTPARAHFSFHAKNFAAAAALLLSLLPLPAHLQPCPTPCYCRRRTTRTTQRPAAGPGQTENPTP